MAAELIRELDLPDGVKVVVLFDTFFLCPVVVRACKEKGFHFVSTLKSNRNVFKNGRKLKAGAYARTCFQNRGSQRLTVAKANGTTSFQFVDVGWVDVSGAGRVHLVYSRKGRSKKALGIVTDDPSLSASEILQVYGERWPIEVFFKDSKQLLGLGQYQNVPYRAAVIHLHLVCFAYALLTHLAIQREGEKGTRKRDKAARLSTGDLQNELRWLAWEDLVDCLETLETGHDVIQELRRLLGAA
jgi:hypothetical protein